MVIFVKSTTKEQFQREFFEAIKMSEKNDWKLLGMPVAGHFFGSVNGDNFTLGRTNSIFSNLPQRLFFGNLSYKNNQLVVEGEFRFSRLYYYALSILGIICLLSLFLTAKETFMFGETIKRFLLLFAVPASFWGACILSSLFQEKETIKLLENL